MRVIENSTKFATKQNGVALFVALILLLVLTIVGLSAAQRSNLQESMAANTHIHNMAFNAAESALGGFLAEGNSGNKLSGGHILEILRQNNSLSDQCYDEAGVRSDCPASDSDVSVFLDGDRAGVIVSRMSARVIDPCNRLSCGAFSLAGSGSSVGCRVIQVDATGRVANSVANHSLIAYEVTSCIQ